MLFDLNGAVDVPPYFVEVLTELLEQATLINMVTFLTTPLSKSKCHFPVVTWHKRQLPFKMA